MSGSVRVGWDSAPRPLREALEEALQGVLEAMQRLQLADYGSVQDLHRATDILWQVEDELDNWRADRMSKPEDAA